MNELMRMALFSLGGLTVGIVLGALLFTARPGLAADAGGAEGKRHAGNIEDSGADVAGPQNTEEPTPDAARTRAVEAESEAVRLSHELDRAKEQQQDLRRERDDLRERVGELEAEIVFRDASRNLDRFPPLLIEFGEDSATGSLRRANADWDSLGEVSHALGLVAREYVAASKEKRIPQVWAQLAWRRAHEAMRPLSLRVTGRKGLPTHVQQGEFTHPLLQVNLLAAILAGTEWPLNESQKQEVAAAGVEYENRWKTLQDSYHADTFRLEKILDEVELKEWFKGRMFAALTDQQRETVMPAEASGVIGIDFWSGALLLMGDVVTPVQSEGAEALGAAVATTVGNLYGFSQERLAAMENVFADWLSEAPSEFRLPAPRLHVEEAIAAGRAQLKALRQIAHPWADSNEQREKIRNEGSIIVPRVVPTD